MTSRPNDDATTQRVDAFATKTGAVMGRAEWLDVHFEADRAEYEEAFRLVG